jgi:hypothetical protein
MATEEDFDIGIEWFEIRVKMFAGQEPVTVGRRTALHLFRLVQRYNWCLESVDTYRHRWSGFWPALRLLERMAIVKFVSANCDGEFGRRMVVCQPPVDFEGSEGDHRAHALTQEVEADLSRVLGIHYGKVASHEQVHEWLVNACPKEMALVTSVGGVARVFGNREWFEPERVARDCAALFMECGWDQVGATVMSGAVQHALLCVYKSMENARC